MYTNQHSPALGFFLIDDLAAVAGFAKGATTLVHDVSGLFGNSSTDQDRADRLNYIVNAALAGSVLAGRAILGGLTPKGIGAASERKAWQTAYSNLLTDAPAVMQRAQSAGAFWYYGQDGGDHPLSPQLRKDIAAELRGMGLQYPTNNQYIATPIGSSSSVALPVNAGAGGTSSAGRVQTLPLVTTTAPFNYTPYVIGGAAVLAALLMRKR